MERDYIFERPSVAVFGENLYDYVQRCSEV